MPASPPARSGARIGELVTALQAALRDAVPHLRFAIEVAMHDTRSLELTLSWTAPGAAACSVSRPVDLLAPGDDGIDALLDAVCQRLDARAAA